MRVWGLALPRVFGTSALNIAPHEADYAPGGDANHEDELKKI